MIADCNCDTMFQQGMTGSTYRCRVKMQLSSNDAESVHCGLHDSSKFTLRSASGLILDILSLIKTGGKKRRNGRLLFLKVD